jgi:EAL domain-containing protein (putative c-di-GMP-specific phosphodiesterase class I)/FixJ family two-component response regulator
VPKFLERFAGMSVLIVDDNLSNLDLLKSLLNVEGLPQAYTESDSRKIFERFAEVRPDLIMLDLHMPNIDGFEILTQIKTIAGGGYLPVIVLSADATPEARERALYLGAQDFLTKPFDLIEVVLRTANLLETRQLYSSLRHNMNVDGFLEPAARESAANRIQGVLHDESINQAYQAVFNLRDLSIVGYEGLSRFPTAEFGSPDRWFADAFKVGRGIDLEWMAATKMLSFLNSSPPTTFLALNMSPATIAHMNEADLCPPELCPRVVIEVTEHVPIEDYATIESAMKPMRANGARLAADDIGSGYAGFRHLLQLRPEIIKLDISLIRGIHVNRGQRALASALLTFAQDIGATVIAEGVELQEEMETIKEIGIPWAQGYYLGRPTIAA